MIVKKCFVSSFGRLRDKEYVFTNGINTIKEDNGAGKTTLTVFIKSMFYGLDEGRRSLKDSERKRYTPWGSNSLFGGYIEFEYKGKDFRIERFFGKKSSDDTLKLIDLETMTEHNNNANLGERLFGIDENGFISTCFMSQNDFMSLDNESVISKFNDICQTNNSNTFADAYKLIENESKQYKRAGDKGYISDVKKEIYLLNQKVERKEYTERVISELKREISQAEKETEFLKKQISELTSQVEIAGKKEATLIKKMTKEKLIEQLDYQKEKKEKLFNSINGKTITDEEYESMIELYNSYLALRSKFESIKNATQNKSKGKIDKKIYLPTLILLAVVGACGFLINNIISYVGAGCFLFALIFTLIFNSTRKIEKVINFSDENLLNIAYQKLLEFLYSYGYGENELPQFLIIITKIKDISKDLATCNKDVATIEQDLKKYNIDLDVDCGFEIQDSYEVLSKNLSSKQRLLSIKIQELGNKGIRVHQLEEEILELKDADLRKNELSQLLKDSESKYEVLTKTLFYLDKANENLKIKYRQPLQDSLNKYLNKILPNAINAVIDTDLNISIEEGGTLKQSEYYSKGFQDLFEICKRLALCEVLFTKDKPFIVLDDVFFNLDEEKFEKAKETINLLAGDYQIMYFVCHKSRSI